MILAVLQARVSSTRLPGKVLEPILGLPMLFRQLERVRRARRIDRLIVATSTRADDAAIASLCDMALVPCFRGALNDVLDRFYEAARSWSPSHVVRLTGDCPLADWTLIDRTINFCLEARFDYASNALRPTWPDGLDVEVIRFSVLERAWREAMLPSEREHVTPFIHHRPETFVVGSLEQAMDFSALRWTVDEPDDLTFVRKVYQELYPRDPAFTTQDVLALMERNPELKELNRARRRNEGLQPSLIADTAFLTLGRH